MRTQKKEGEESDLKTHYLSFFYYYYYYLDFKWLFWNRQITTKSHQIKQKKKKNARTKNSRKEFCLLAVLLKIRLHLFEFVMIIKFNYYN